MSRLKIIAKLTATVIISLSIAACVTTKGGNTGQSDTGRVVTGAAIGGAVGLLGCKLLGGKDCAKYAIAGAAIGGGLAHLLNQRQKAAYEAARAANAKVSIVERPDTKGGDVVVDELYESPTSAKLSPLGREILRKTLIGSLEEGETTKKLQFSPVYSKESDASRLLAEERAKNAQEEFAQLVPNMVFDPIEAHENLPQGSGQLVVIR